MRVRNITVGRTAIIAGAGVLLLASSTAAAEMASATKGSLTKTSAPGRSASQITPAAVRAEAFDEIDCCTPNTAQGYSAFEELMRDIPGTHLR